MDKGFDEETEHDDWSDISDTTEDSESSSNSHGGEFFDVTFTKLLDLIPQSISNCKKYSEIIDRKICQVISKDITVNEFEDFMKKLAAPLLKVSEPITRKEIKIKRTDILGSFPGICQNKGILFTLTEILDQHEYKDIPKCFEILIKDMHLNYLIMNLKAFLNGYEILVFDYENIVEKDGVMTHIDNGVIPYEILDKLLESRVVNVNKDAQWPDKALLVKLFYMNEESATIALRNFPSSENVKSGKGPLKPAGNP
ncbi:hypothetical protein TNCV_129261 [Trichonephila clavipes]|nr:hypothetical protein TNCV_129261 [Trichonephila clavipes]